MPEASKTNVASATREHTEIMDGECDPAAVMNEVLTTSDEVTQALEKVTRLCEKHRKSEVRLKDNLIDFSAIHKQRVAALRTYKSDNRTLRTSLNSERESSHQKDIEIATLRQQALSMQEEIDRSNIKIADLTLPDKVIQSIQESKQLKIQSCMLQRELKSCKSDLDSCKNELDSCRSDLASCRSELDSCRSELEGVKKELTLHETNMSHLICDICLKEVKRLVLDCGHAFCAGCVDVLRDQRENHFRCPYCRGDARKGVWDLYANPGEGQISLWPEWFNEIITIE